MKANSPEKQKANNERYMRSNYAEILERNRQWRANNPDKVKQSNRSSYLADRENRIAYAKNAWTVRNHLIQSQGVSKFYTKELIEIYKNCPSGHHVDHDIPLRGKTVCGLHIPDNLQYLPAKVNLSKGNSFKEQMK